MRGLVEGVPTTFATSAARRQWSIRAILPVALAAAAPAWAATTVPPVGALQAAAQQFMQPAGYDDRGCATFQSWSPSQRGPVGPKQYRRADGTFTTVQSEAACSYTETARDR